MPPPRWAAVLALLHAARIPPLCNSSRASSTTCPAGCTKWFDGCENCACTNGIVGVCVFNPTCIAPGRAYCKSHGPSRHAAPHAAALLTPVPTPSHAESTRSRGQGACCSPTDTSCCGPAAVSPVGAPATTQPITHTAAQSASALHDTHAHAACDGLVGGALAARLRGITHSFEMCMMKANFGKGAGGGGGEVSAVCSCITDIDAHLAHFKSCPQAQHELGQIASHARGLCSSMPAPAPMRTPRPTPTGTPAGGTNAPHPMSALRAAQHRDEMKRLGDISRRREKARASRASRVHAGLGFDVPERPRHVRSTSMSPKQSCPKKCVRWFDGCNSCACEGGEVGLCVFNPKCFGAGSGTGVPHCKCALGQPCAKAFVKQKRKVAKAPKAPRHSGVPASKVHPHSSSEKHHKQTAGNATARAHKESDFKSAKLKQQRKHEKDSKAFQFAQEKILKKQKATERHAKATSRRRAPTVAPTSAPTPAPTSDPKKEAQLKKLEATLAKMKRKQSDTKGMKRADSAARAKLVRLHKMEAALAHMKQAHGGAAGAAAGKDGSIALMRNMQESSSPAQLRARLLALRKRMGLLGRVPQSASGTKLVLRPARPHSKGTDDTVARGSGRLRISADAAGIGGSGGAGGDSASVSQVRTHVDTGAGAFNEAKALFDRLQQEAKQNTKNTAVHALVLLRAVHIGFGGAGAARFPVAIAAAIDAACGQRLQTRRLNQQGKRRRLHVFRIPGAGVTMGGAKCDALARAAVRVQATRRVPIPGQAALHYLSVRFELLARNSGDASAIVALMQQPGGTFASELAAQLKMLWPQFAMSYRPIANGAGGQAPDALVQAAAVGLPEQVVQQKVRWARLAEKKRETAAAAAAAAVAVAAEKRAASGDKHRKATTGDIAAPPSRIALFGRLALVVALVGACVMAARGKSASTAAHGFEGGVSESEAAFDRANLSAVVAGDGRGGVYGGVGDDFARAKSAGSAHANAAAAEAATATDDPAVGGARAMLSNVSSGLTSFMSVLHSSRFYLPKMRVPAATNTAVQQQQMQTTSASELVPVSAAAAPVEPGGGIAAASAEPAELAVVRRAIDAAVQAEAYEEAALLKRRLELLRLSASNKVEQAALRAKIDAAVAREEYAAAAAFKPELDALRQRDAQIRLQAQSVVSGTAIRAESLPVSTDVLQSHSVSTPSNFDDDDDEL